MSDIKKKTSQYSFVIKVVNCQRGIQSCLPKDREHFFIPKLNLRSLCVYTFFGTNAIHFPFRTKSIDIFLKWVFCYEKFQENFSLFVKRNKKLQVETATLLRDIFSCCQVSILCIFSSILYRLNPLCLSVNLYMEHFCKETLMPTK